MPTRCTTAAPPASGASRSSTSSGFRAFVGEYAPTADTIAKTYRIVNTEEDVRALAERLRAAGAFAMRHAARRTPSAMRAGIVGMAFSTATA